MNLQKIKEAVELGLAFYDDDMYVNHRPETRDKFIQALAEFEKPAEDEARECAAFAISLFVKNKTVGDISKAIQQYAKSYHQRNCAECKKETAETILLKHWEKLREDKRG